MRRNFLDQPVLRPSLPAPGRTAFSSLRLLLLLLLLLCHSLAIKRDVRISLVAVGLTLAGSPRHLSQVSQSDHVIFRYILFIICFSSVATSELEVCMGVGNPMRIPFPWESTHGNGNSHTAHDGNGNGNKANGNGNSIYFTRVKIPKIIVMH